jgi:hypothetical protein
LLHRFHFQGVEGPGVHRPIQEKRSKGNRQEKNGDHREQVSGHYLSPKHKAKAVNILDRVFDMSQIPPQAKNVVELRP